jgi:indole-3-acetate O-methyltransferase
MHGASSAGGPAIAMRGAGYYSAHTAGAKTVIDKVGDLVVEAVGRMPILEPGRPFVIADFGAADGGTSMDMMHRLVETIRRREPDREISIVYTDLPHNDFSTLFRLTQGLLGPDIRAPLAQIPNLHIFGSGTSFYRQVINTGALSFGFSATAMHWLSRRPCMIADHVQAVGAAPAEREMFRAQAIQDWEAILLARARELRTGGRLALANFCIDEARQYLGHTTGVDMFDSFARHWRELYTAGRIGEAEYVNATFPQFYKTPAEFAAPFRDPTSAISKAGLKLEHISTMVTPCPYAEAFRIHRDAAAFAKAYVPTLRSWSETVFAGALDPSRSAADRTAIPNAFYGSYEAAVARAPDDHRMDYVHCVMELAKVA